LPFLPRQPEPFLPETSASFFFLVACGCKIRQGIRWTTEKTKQEKTAEQLEKNNKKEKTEKKEQRIVSMERKALVGK